MDTQSIKSRLQLPDPKHTRLGICQPTTRDLNLWIQNLPKANIGETARLLYQAITELNNLQTTADTRMQLLELLRPEIIFINAQLAKHFTNNAVMLDERSRKIASLCQTLQHLLSTGYKLVIAQSIEQSGPLLTQALQRAMHSIFMTLLRTYQQYQTAPQRAWFELHLLYIIARKKNIHAQAVSESLLQGVTTQSPDAAYRCILLLSCARTNQMRQSDIATVAHALPSWCHLSNLQNPELESSVFIVHLNSDAAPSYKELLEPQYSKAQLGFNTQALAKALHDHQQPTADQPLKNPLAVPDSVSTTMLAQLCNAWGKIAKRDFHRTSSKGFMQACLGMSAVHYYLSGQIIFEQSLTTSQSARAQYKTDNQPADIWAQATGVGASKEQDPLQVGLIEYGEEEPAFEGYQGSAKAHAEPATERYPLHTLAIVNYSPGGFCLAWPDAVPNTLQAGQIIALRETDHTPWSAAVIRWISQVTPLSTQMGVELLAPNAQPCGLQLHRSGNQPSLFLRALLMPEVPALSRPASLITPRIPFQEGHKVVINHQGTELKAVLKQRSMHTDSISQFEYTVSSTAPTADTTSTATTEAPSANEDFNSLWKLL